MITKPDAAYFVTVTAVARSEGRLGDSLVQRLKL